MTSLHCNKKVTDFLCSKSLQNNFSIKSVNAYKADLISFHGYLEKYHKIDFEKVTLLILEDYLAWLCDNEYKPAAITRKVSSIRQFYKFLYIEGYVFENPTRFLISPKFQQTAVTPLTIKQVEQLIGVTDNFVFPHNLRLKALIEIAFGAGLRVSELVTLSYESVNHNRDYTIIKGKGNKERLIPLTTIMKKSITDYLPYRAYFSNGVKNSFLFPSTGREGYLSRVRFFQLLKQLAVYAHIDPQFISPHVFRHSFALSMLRGGADLKSLQALLGHENIDTVENYTKIYDDDLWSMISKHHPLKDTL